MAEVSGDPFQKKSKVKVNGSRPAAAPAASETPRDETCKKLYGSDVKGFLADYREAIEERKDLSEFRKIAETLHIPVSEFYSALYGKRK